MAMAKVFKNRVLNCHVSTPEGRLITFVEGHHITTIQKDIDFLEKEIAEGNNDFLYVDPNELEVDTEELSEEGRINKIKRQAIEEYLRNQKASSNSHAVPSDVNPGTSATVNPETVDTSVGHPKDSLSDDVTPSNTPIKVEGNKIVAANPSGQKIVIPSTVINEAKELKPEPAKDAPKK